jgi:mannose-6-phosphate isomerase-like protein (cupin superfamily)
MPAGSSPPSRTVRAMHRGLSHKRGCRTNAFGVIIEPTHSSALTIRRFTMTTHDITRHPIHLGLGATAEVEPTFTGELDWYNGYGQRHAGDGAEGRLVCMHHFTESWRSWEMHPHGAEVVLCIAGTMTLHQEGAGGKLTSLKLAADQYVINPPGIWHTADVSGTATALFITAGQGTQHRPR